MTSGRLQRIAGGIGIVLFWAALQPAALAQQLASGGVESLFKENAKAVVLIRLLDAEGATVALGSGFIVGSSGVIVTNHHVIEPVSDGRLVVKLSQGDVYDDVWVIHDDPRRDFAVIRIKASELPSIKLGSVDETSIGQQVLAIGNPLGLEQTLTVGIVSSIRLEPESGYRFIQHQAPISSGSSGGPLLNMRGEAIGVNTFIIQGGQNLNGAVPVDYIKPYVQDTAGVTYAEYARSLAPPPAENPPSLPKPLTAAWKTYSDAKHGISFRIPENWQFIEEAVGDSQSAFSGTVHSNPPGNANQPQDSIHVNLRIETRDAAADLPAAAKSEHESIAKVAGNARTVSTRFFEDRHYAGFYWLWAAPESNLVGFDAVMFTASNKYGLHGTCYSSNPISCARTFEDFFDSFAFPGLVQIR
ncbi:MAG: trypsin-like peptidase domain-containing protein [Acidobacteria bacterium]|nr:trypsin-like peptidase domain-containing protein [Acidobacteriota bacterium]